MTATRGKIYYHAYHLIWGTTATGRAIRAKERGRVEEARHDEGEGEGMGEGEGTGKGFEDKRSRLCCNICLCCNIFHGCYAIYGCHSCLCYDCTWQ